MAERPDEDQASWVPDCPIAVRALAAGVVLLVGCHTPPAPPPARTPPKSGLSVAEESFVQCGLADAQRKMHECEDFDPHELATFEQVDKAFVRVALPPVYDPFALEGRQPRFRRYAGVDDKEVVALARSYLCRTDLVPERRFPAGARAVAAYQAARVQLVVGRKEEAAVWFHEAALGPPDLPETAIASVVQLDLLDELGSRAERVACFDVMEEWVHDAHRRLCDVERPYARRACPILGRIGLDLDRMNAFHTRLRP